MVPSLKVPVAVNCCVPPAVTVTLAGVIASDCSVPVPTVRVVVPFTPKAEAVIVTDPPFLPNAMPLERREATLGLEDFQETPARFVATLPSLKVPVAVNLSKVWAAILGLAGLIAIDTKCAVDTVSVVEPLTLPNVALMLVLPLAKLVTSPVLLMVAAAGLEEVQRTDFERSCVLLSLKVPVAVNCRVVPTAVVELAGVTAIETKLALVTVSDAEPLMEPDVAVMVVVPVPTPVAKPELSTVATDVAGADQVTDVKSCVLPSSKLPTALNWSVVPRAMDCAPGLTVIESRCAGTTVRVDVSLKEPTVAVMSVEPAARVAARPLLSTVATVGSDEVQVTALDRSELVPSV